MFTTTHDFLPGISLHLHRTDKFKTVIAKVYLKQPLESTQSATANSLLVRMLGRGSRKYPNMRKINIFMESLYGAAFGSDIDKVGEYALIEYYLEMLSPEFISSRVVRSQIIPKAFSFLRDMLTAPCLVGGRFRADHFRQEQKNLRDIIEGLMDDKMAYAEERCNQEMCKDEPYGIFEYGRIEDIDKVTPASLAEHHARVLRTAPMDIFVAGQFDPDKIQKSLAWTFRSFRHLHKGIEAIPRAPVRPACPAGRDADRGGFVVSAQPNGSPLIIKESQPIDQGKLVIGLRTNTTWSDDAIFDLMVANGVLGGFPHSKLFRNVREKEGLAYYASSNLEKTKGLMMIRAGINHDKFDKAVAVIKDQISAVQQSDISDSEMSDTKKGIITRLETMDDNPGALINFHEELLLNRRASLTIKDVISRIRAVDKSAVARAAQKVKLDTIYFLTSSQ